MRRWVSLHSQDEPVYSWEGCPWGSKSSEGPVSKGRGKGGKEGGYCGAVMAEPLRVMAGVVTASVTPIKGQKAKPANEARQPKQPVMRFAEMRGPGWM